MVSEQRPHVRDHSRTPCWCNPPLDSYVRYTGEEVRAAEERAWEAACDYLASRNWEDMTREAYTAALLKAWNANPHRANALETEKA